ncbi:MAG: Crp/Fnr family transcriptional regulator [Burkholderiaceae bacterium]|nr:Crp/Fnr family transcriptional regulator [Burkholderiaceae bacterium]
MTPAKSLPADCIVHADIWSNSRCALMPMTTASPLSDLLTLMGCTRDGVPHEPDFSVPIWQVRAGAALLLEGACSSHVYVVRTGTFKCIRTAEDGYEQVLAFAGQGEVLAFEAMCGDAQRMGAVSLEDSSVYALPIREINGWRRLSLRFDHVLQVALSRQLTRAGQITEMMAAVSSDVRLARFLVWWSNRMAERGQSPRRFLLRMSRRDIASLLGVAHETVSRSFSNFVENGLLRVDNREIEIVDFGGLKARTRNTRGLVDETPRRDGSETAPRRSSHRAGAAAAVTH